MQITASAGTFGSEDIEFNPKQRALIDTYCSIKLLKQLCKDIAVSFRKLKQIRRVIDINFVEKLQEDYQVLLTANNEKVVVAM